jgi:hypothetical protein
VDVFTYGNVTVDTFRIPHTLQAAIERAMGSLRRGGWRVMPFTDVDTPQHLARLAHWISGNPRLFSPGAMRITSELRCDPLVNAALDRFWTAALADDGKSMQSTKEREKDEDGSNVEENMHNDGLPPELLEFELEQASSVGEASYMRMSAALHARLVPGAREGEGAAVCRDAAGIDWEQDVAAAGAGAGAGADAGSGAPPAKGGRKLLHKAALLGELFKLAVACVAADVVHSPSPEAHADWLDALLRDTVTLAGDGWKWKPPAEVQCVVVTPPAAAARANRGEHVEGGYAQAQSARISFTEQDMDRGWDSAGDGPWAEEADCPGQAPPLTQRGGASESVRKQRRGFGGEESGSGSGSPTVAKSYVKRSSARRVLSNSQGDPVHLARGGRGTGRREEGGRERKEGGRERKEEGSANIKTWRGGGAVPAAPAAAAAAAAAVDSSVPFREHSHLAPHNLAPIREASFRKLKLHPHPGQREAKPQGADEVGTAPVKAAAELESAPGESSSAAPTRLRLYDTRAAQSGVNGCGGGGRSAEQPAYRFKTRTLAKGGKGDKGDKGGKGNKGSKGGKGSSRSRPNPDLDPGAGDMMLVKGGKSKLGDFGDSKTQPTTFLGGRSSPTSFYDDASSSSWVPQPAPKGSVYLPPLPKAMDRNRNSPSPPPATSAFASSAAGAAAAAAAAVGGGVRRATALEQFQRIHEPHSYRKPQPTGAWNQQTVADATEEAARKERVASGHKAAKELSSLLSEKKKCHQSHASSRFITEGQRPHYPHHPHHQQHQSPSPLGGADSTSPSPRRGVSVSFLPPIRTAALDVLEAQASSRVTVGFLGGVGQDWAGPPGGAVQVEFGFDP